MILHPPRVTVDVNWEVLDLQDRPAAGGQLSRPGSRQRGLARGAQVRSLQQDVGVRGPRSENLVAQMSLLQQNAERHRDNPEFQQDMLDTVAHVERRMRTLMAQLIEKTSIDQKRPVDIGEIMQRIVHDKRASRPHPQLTVM